MTEQSMGEGGGGGTQDRRVPKRAKRRQRLLARTGDDMQQATTPDFCCMCMHPTLTSPPTLKAPACGCAPRNLLHTHATPATFPPHLCTPLLLCSHATAYRRRRASRSHSSRVRMSPSRTGPLTLRTRVRSLSWPVEMNSTRTWVTLPVLPVRPSTRITFASTIGVSCSGGAQTQHNKVSMQSHAWPQPAQSSQCTPHTECERKEKTTAYVCTYVCVNIPC